MKKFALSFLFCLLLSFVITPSALRAQSRSTTFDDRSICEQSKGIWREFGNGCSDNCESKFDKYEICTNALTYACDCGNGRCWNKNKCVKMSSYKIIFDKESEENEKLLAKKAQERAERIKNDPNLDNYLHNLYVKKDAAAGTNAGDNAGANGQPQTQAQAQQQAQAKAIQGQSQALIATDPNSGVAANNSVPTEAITQLTITPANSNQQQVPPLFAQQEARKQKEAAIATPSPAGSTSNGLPALPVIPLPQ